MAAGKEVEAGGFHAADGDRRRQQPPQPNDSRGVLGHSLILATAAFAATVGTGCAEPAPDPTWASVVGETAMAKANCLACHPASEAARERIRPIAGPVLTNAGDRLTPSYLRRFIADPHTTHRSTRMPDALHGLAPGEKTEAVEDLVHFLTASKLDPNAKPAPADVLPEDLSRGERLFRSVGCAACHGKGERGRYAQMTWHAALAAFIADPLSVRPGGLMPDCQLTPDEASAVAAWLLEAQGVDESAEEEGQHVKVRSPGLLVAYFERPMSTDGVPDDDRDSTWEGVASTIDASLPHRADEYAFRFSGELEVPADGRYTFHLGSDDGSTLDLGGERLIDHGGVHGFGFKSATIELAKGWHRIVVRFWEVTGEDDLALEWEGPGMERGPIDPALLAHEAIRLTPPNASFVPDPARVAKGRERFASMGCANCHAGETRTAPALSGLRAGRGCLSDEPPPTTPRYVLDPATKAAIATTLEHVRDLDATPAPAVRVAHALTRLGCLQCHVRDGVGGPAKESLPLFTADGAAELGDQGRLPPSLSGVGAKLRPEVLASVIEEGEKARPYMLTRMPSFGLVATHGLAESLDAADRMPGQQTNIAFSPESANTGRLLVGTTGLSCITCHTTNGRPSLGVPAIDLGTMHRRLRPGWFLAFLEDPARFTPGTRMTRFWMPNERIFPEHAGGDPAQQRAAIWNYLSLGASMPPPPGLVLKQGQYELVPSGEPIVFGAFMRDVSPRTICVGYAELVHAAFDAQAGRLAKVWRGEFIDAKGTWDGRAGQLESPLGKNVLDLPAGPAFARLASRDSEVWPLESGRYRGWERDSERRPSFLIEVDGATIRERPIPLLRAGGAWMRRSIEASFTEDRSDLWMRAAVGGSIAKQGDRFVVDGRLRIVTDASGAIVRTVDGRQELLIPIDFKYVEGAEPRYRAVFAVDMDW